MSALAEFVGGPLDGRIIELEDPAPRINVPRPPRFMLPSDHPIKLPLHLIYQRERRRRTPTGDWIFQYELITPDVDATP